MKAFFDFVKDINENHPLLVNVIKSAIIIVAAYLLLRIGNHIIKKLFNKKRAQKAGFDIKKTDTMASMFSSILKYAIIIVAAVIILVDIFNVKSIIAAAGVVSVALGLGVQSLIKDLIAGFFIIIEEQYAVGDYVTLDTMQGTVEAIELRITKIRDFNGDLHIIPNGDIRKSTNHSRDFKTIWVYVPVSYENELEKIFNTAERVCKEITETETKLTEPFKVAGITEMGRGYMTIGITAKSVPNEQWRIERAVRKRIFEEFRKEGISFAKADIINKA